MTSTNRTARSARKLNYSKLPEGLKPYQAMNRLYDARQRCHVPEHPLYANYGGKGISCRIEAQDFLDWFCEEYPKFASKYPGKRPSVNRLDHTKDYTLDNIELISVAANTREVYQRRGNQSKWGTKIESEEAILTIHTISSVLTLVEHYKVHPNTIKAIKRGVNRRGIYDSIK